MDRLKASLPNFAVMRRLVMRFRGILRSHNPTKLDGWLKNARETGLYGGAAMRSTHCSANWCAVRQDRNRRLQAARR